jgi:hypothetical protein
MRAHKDSRSRSFGATALLFTIAGFTLCALWAYGAEPPQGEENFFKRAAKVIGNDAKTGVNQAGKAFKQLGKDIGHGTSKAVKDVGHGMKESAERTGKQAKETFK